MRYLKLLGLAAVVVAALMGFAGGAGATTITSPTGTVATPTIKAESEGAGITLANPVMNIQCNSTIEGKVENHGASVTVEVKLSTLTMTGCANGWHATTVSPGTIEVHWTNGYNGTVTWSGMTITTTRFGVICNYATNSTSIGTLTGGTPATIDIVASIPIHSGSSALCGTGSAKLEGSYKLAGPESLYVDEGFSPPLPGTTITSPTGTVATPTIKAESEGHVTLANPIANISCAWTYEGKVESHGAEAAARAKLTSLSFTGCTNGWHVTSVTLGELTIEWTSGYDGTVTSTGMKFSATRLGIICVYETGATKLGMLTGGSPATIDIEATIPIKGSPESSALCGTGSAKLEGSYKLAGPESLYVDEA